MTIRIQNTTDDYAVRFTAFAAELEKLSNKHGIAVRSTGGIQAFDPDQHQVRYDDDWTSGDLEVAYDKI